MDAPSYVPQNSLHSSQPRQCSSLTTSGLGLEQVIGWILPLRLIDDLPKTFPQVRPRGWHLWEKHVLVDGRPVPGGIFDFALFFFHCARPLLDRGSGAQLAFQERFVLLPLHRRPV
jgi:Malate synthase